MSLPAKIILLISLLLPGSVLAQSVSVTVDRTAMDINDVIRMQIAVEGAQGELALPQMPDFSIVSRSESTSISIINGAMSQQKGITLLLQPVKTGTLSIGEAKLIVNGKIAASSRPLTVKVTGGASPQRKKQPEPETEVEPLSEVKTGAKDGKNVPFFINAGIPERELFVGEGFLLGFDLYIRADVGVGSVNLVSQPKLEGFIVEGIPVNAGQKAFMKQADGAVYNVYPQFRAVITPAGAGDFTIDSLVLDLYSGDFFGNRRFRIASEPVVVKVSKLPEAGRPAGFQDGNIGKFAITSGLSKGVIKAGEKSVLTLEISGAGNFKNIAVTKIPQIKNLTLDLIPSSDMDDVRVDEAGISGKRYFQYLLTPSAPGEIEIPPFRFDYFNPISRKYETAESEPLTLKVLETGASVAASKEPAGGDELAAIVWDIGQGAEGGGSGIFKKYAHVFFVIPLTIILAAETIFRLKRRRESNYGRIKSDRAFRTAVRELRILKNGAKQDPKGIYEKIEGILNAYMSDGFSINIRGGGNIREELAGLG
ncbi:MAG: protein BatD, partial [Deltaproteobacteria bacterium]|nr:protein BatD [Deltaproteobacteria bacterium]